MRNRVKSKWASLVAVVALCSVLACNREAVPSVQPQPEASISVKSGRLAFKSYTQFSETLKQLRQFKGIEEIIKWEENYSYNSLRKYNTDNPLDRHLADMDLPTVYQAILNSNGEYMVGDTIVWFDKFYNYFIPKHDEKLLALVKQNPSAYKDRHEIKLTTIARKAQENDQLGVNATNIGTHSGPDARWQKIWAVNNQTGPWRKTIYEIQAYSFFTNPGYDNGVNLRIKEEWWNGSSWRPNANETQHPVVDVQFGIVGDYSSSGHGIQQVVYASAGYLQINPSGISGPHSTYNYDLDLNIFSEHRSYQADSFTVDMTGVIECTTSISGVMQTDSYFKAQSVVAGSYSAPLW